MSRQIGLDHIAVQVETSRADVWVPDGLALERRNYPADGVAFDLMNGLALKEGQYINDGGSLDWWRVRPLSNKHSVPVTHMMDGVAKNSESIGPALVQTRMPINVRPGMQVMMTGQYQVRSTGTQEKSASGIDTQVHVRATLWGTGSRVDEYGVEQEIKLPLDEYQAFLQSSTEITVQSYTIGFPKWVTVPHNIDAVYLSISLVGGDSYVGGTYESQRWGSLDMHYFGSPKIDASTADPLRIHVREPLNIHPTYPHPLSATGFAFRDRAVFENITPGVEATVMGEPGGGAITVDVYAWTGSRGALLTTVAVPAGEKITTVLAHTGAVELVSGSTFYVESVLAPVWSTATAEQTRLYRYEYTDVTDPVNKVGTRLVEADLGVTTVRFVSDTVAPFVAAGKRARVLGLHPGVGDGYTPLVTGTIRGRRLVQDLQHKQQVEVAIHDAWSALGMSCPVAYDQLREYGMMVHRAGTPVWIDGVDHTGPSGPLPEGFDYFPSYHADRLTLREALIMSRNTHKGWLFVDRAGRIQLTSTLPDVIALDVSDLPGQGDMSYARNIELAGDTANLVTTVQVDEHLLDRDDYVNGRNLSSQDPPYLFGQIKAKTQSIDYRRAGAVDTYGESKITLPVIRGSGAWEDIRAGNFGESFAAWAAEILDDYAHERDDIATVTLPVRPADIAKVAALTPLDAIAVRYQGQVYLTRIRAVEHEIGPGRWLCTLDCSISGDQTYWLPPHPTPTDLALDGGTHLAAGPGLVDAGNPAAPGLGGVDGGSIDPVPPPDPEPEPDHLADTFPVDGALSAPWIKTSSTTTAMATVTGGALTGPNAGSNNIRLRYVYDEPVGPDQWAEVVVDDTSFATGVILRSDNTADGACVFVGLDASGGASISYIAAGAVDPVVQATSPYPFAPGTVVRGEITGTTVRAYVNGLLLIERTDVTATGNYVGVRAYGSSGRIASWTAGDL